jgi:L-lactate dehydrogenase complex protein LldF
VSFPLDARARLTLPDAAALARHDAAVHRLRVERDRALSSVPDLEALRDHAAAIKAHVLDHLDRYLEEFEARARERGAEVHWAEDAASHNRIVADLLAARGATRVVKSKSMLTEECGLNPALEARGVEVVDTDLGERIVQLGDEPPSHIVIPAIHRRREEVGALFHRHLGTPAGESDPARLMAAARADLRARFLAAQAAITGVNFAIAETGTLVVVTNEGNADLGMSLPPLHIASLGIEKVIPALDDLAVFLRLLARSATGQALSVYTSLVTGPRPGGELHVVLVDAGRTRLLASPVHRSALRCIRCGACLNTCPVYRRAGGHAYGTSVAGPIGAVLAPALSADPAARSLPYASSLCGSCTAVCPVRIDLHGQLLAWRRESPALPTGLRLGARVAAAILARPRLFRAAGRALRRLWPLLERSFPGNPARAWLASRALPPHPGPSFAERWAERGDRAAAQHRASGEREP